MNRKRKHPTADDWARWEETERLLAERIARIEEKLASRTPEPLDPELRRRIAVRAEELLGERARTRSDKTQRLLAERIAYNELVYGAVSSG